MRGSSSTWIAGIAGGLVVLAIVGVIHYATRIGNSGTQQQARSSVISPTSQRSHYGAMDIGIAYGSTAKQVLHRIGPPTNKQGRCWLYDGHVGSIRGRYPGPYVDAIKFCFAEGPAGGTAVMQIYSHYVAHTIRRTDPITHTVTKKTFPAQWGVPLVMMKVPDWYLQQNA